MTDEPTISVSLDGGKTWLGAPEGVRVMFHDVIDDTEADEPGAPYDLHLNATPEGVILDVVDAWGNGEVVATACLDFEGLEALTQ